MPTRTGILAAALLVASGAVAQPPPPRGSTGPSVPPSSPSLPDIVGPVLPGTGPAPAPPAFPALPDVVPSVVPAPFQKSVEQMILELEALTAQKAQIEKKVGELRVEIRKKLDTLNDRVNKIDGGKGKEARGAPARVGRIILDGFENKKRELAAQETLGKLGVRPGEVLRYPALEEARGQLEKLGLKGVEVVELPNEMNSEFKDILVRCEK